MEAKYTEKENTDLRSKIFALETLREKSWLERKLGPLWYKIVRGVFTNPLSVIGLVITSLFILMAIFAPVLARASARCTTPI